jgi:hypothetical protein
LGSFGLACAGVSAQFRHSEEIPSSNDAQLDQTPGQVPNWSRRKLLDPNNGACRLSSVSPLKEESRMNQLENHLPGTAVWQVRKRSAFHRLTEKQARFVRAKVCGMSSAQAARHAGYAESIARKPAKITNSPAVRTALVELLEEAGVTDSMLAARIREGLDATDAKFVTTRAGKTQRMDVVDFATRRSYLVMALKLKGLLPRRNTEHRATLEEILEKASLPS